MFTITYYSDWEEGGAHLNKLWDLTSQYSTSLHQYSLTLFWYPHLLLFIQIKVLNDANGLCNS